eukprot:448184_1
MHFSKVYHSYPKKTGRGEYMANQSNIMLPCQNCDKIASRCADAETKPFHQNYTIHRKEIIGNIIFSFHAINTSKTMIGKKDLDWSMCRCSNCLLQSYVSTNCYRN